MCNIGTPEEIICCKVIFWGKEAEGSNFSSLHQGSNLFFWNIKIPYASIVPCLNYFIRQYNNTCNKAWCDPSPKYEGYLSEPWKLFWCGSKWATIIILPVTWMKGIIWKSLSTEVLSGVRMDAAASKFIITYNIWDCALFCKSKSIIFYRDINNIVKWINDHSRFWCRGETCWRVIDIFLKMKSVEYFCPFKILSIFVLFPKIIFQYWRFECDVPGMMEDISKGNNFWISRVHTIATAIPLDLSKGAFLSVSKNECWTLYNSQGGRDGSWII